MKYNIHVVKNITGCVDAVYSKQNYITRLLFFNIKPKTNICNS